MSDAKVTSTDIKLALAEKHHRDFFLTEVKSGSTWLTAPGYMKILDALAIKPSWTNTIFTGYEVKISRGDFLRDAKFYTYEELCNCLYIVCPKGMIDRTELPESIGLMYYDPDKKTLTTRKKAIFRKVEYSVEMLLYIIFSRLESDRYPFFNSKRDYFEEYVAGKRRNQDLAYAVKTKLVQENARLEKELENIKHFMEQREAFLDVKKVCEKHGIWAGWNGSELAGQLDKALARSPVEGADFIIRQLETVITLLKKQQERGEEE